MRFQAQLHRAQKDGWVGQCWGKAGGLVAKEVAYERWRLIDRHIDRYRPSPGWVRPSGWTQTKIGKDCGPRGGKRKVIEAGGRVQAVCR